MSSTRKAKGFLTLGRNTATMDGAWALDTHGKHTSDRNRPSSGVKEHVAMGQTFDRAPGGQGDHRPWVKLAANQGNARVAAQTTKRIHAKLIE
jgi:hypothetical protein